MLFARCKAGASRGRERGRLALLCEMGLGRLASDKMPKCPDRGHMPPILYRNRPPQQPAVTENETSGFGGILFSTPDIATHINVFVVQRSACSLGWYYSIANVLHDSSIHSHPPSTSSSVPPPTFSAKCLEISAPELPGRTLLSCFLCAS